MTALLGALTRDFAIHVSDRLLTRAVTHHPFDRDANKSLLVEAVDGFVVMGYCGPAFIGEVPTDEFLAEGLVGEAIREQDGTLPALSLGRGLPRQKLGALMRQLRSLMAASVLEGREALEVVALGWQWQRGRYRPLALAITWDTRAGSFEISETPRYGHYEPNTMGKVLVGANGSIRDHAEALTDLRTRLSSVTTVDALADEMVRTVRDVAEADPTVGDECTVVIARPIEKAWHVIVRFVSPTTRVATFRGSTAAQSFTPWFLGQTALAAPSVIAGGHFQLSAGSIRATIEAPPVGTLPDEPPSLFISSQTHPRRPVR